MEAKLSLGMIHHIFSRVLTSTLRQLNSPSIHVWKRKQIVQHAALEVRQMPRRRFIQNVKRVQLFKHGQDA
jgi:hypothetical protein